MSYILIVEDEMIPREAIKLRVKDLMNSLKSNHGVKAVGTIEEMWEVLNKEPPIGILLDVSLPLTEMDTINWKAGIDLARELEKKHLDIPIILFTGRGDPFPEEEAKQLKNVIRFFRKPMPGLPFRKALMEIIERRTVK